MEAPTTYCVTLAFLRLCLGPDRESDDVHSVVYVGGR